RRQIIRALVARIEIDEEGATVVYRIHPPSSSGSTHAPVPQPDSTGTSPESSQLRQRRTATACRRGGAGPSLGRYSGVFCRRHARDRVGDGASPGGIGVFPLRFAADL